MKHVRVEGGANMRLHGNVCRSLPKLMTANLVRRTNREHWRNRSAPTHSREVAASRGSDVWRLGCHWKSNWSWGTCGLRALSLVDRLPSQSGVSMIAWQWLRRNVGIRCGSYRTCLEGIGVAPTSEHGPSHFSN